MLRVPCCPWRLSSFVIRSRHLQPKGGSGQTCTDPKVGFTQALLSYLVGCTAQPRRRWPLELLYSPHSKRESRTSLVVQWLRFCASKGGGMCVISGQDTKIPYDLWHSQNWNQKKKQRVGSRGRGCQYLQGLKTWAQKSNCLNLRPSSSTAISVALRRPPAYSLSRRAMGAYLGKSQCRASFQCQGRHLELTSVSYYSSSGSLNSPVSR